MGNAMHSLSLINHSGEDNGMKVFKGGSQSRMGEVEAAVIMSPDEVMVCYGYGGIRWNPKFRLIE